MKKSSLLICMFLCSIVCAAENVKLLLPERIYAVPGVEINVYFQNIVTVINPDNYVFDVDCKKGRNDLKRWRFTPTAKDVGNYKWQIRVINEDGTVAQGESELVVVPADAGKGRKLSILMVGASQTNATIYPARVYELFNNENNPEVTLVGTRRFEPKGVKIPENIVHEGYGGWRWDSFLTRWGFRGKNKNDGMHPDRPIGKNSPFIFPDPNDPNKGIFDLEKYFKLHNNGKSPDIVSFQLGLNDFFLSTDENIAERTAKSLGNMEKLIAEFRKLKPAPEIFIFQHIPGAQQDGFGKSYACNQTSYQYRKNLDFYNRALLKKGKELNLRVVPVYINIDTENNYPFLEQPVNGKNKQKVMRQNNGVHPAPAGYNQMGDTLYCFIKAYLAGK